MELSVIGSGYVGTTIAACFADLGHEVVNIDIEQTVVDAITTGQSPIHEPGLEELIEKHAGDNSTERLQATTEYDAAIETEATFLCLPTPSAPDGSIDISILEDATQSLGQTLNTKDDWHTVIVKSTVLPGTTADRIAPLLAKSSDKTLSEDLGVGMNPEFLREGRAVQDFRNPDKIVLGADDERTIEEMKRIFEPLLQASKSHPVISTGTREAAMIKYANNAFLAAKVSLANDLGNISKEYGVDMYEVADAMGLDSRIERAFLDSGLGWGGSCFPKDVSALIAAGRECGYETDMLSAAVRVNDKQPDRFLSLLEQHAVVENERIAVLGLAFKPGTDDIRNARSIPVIEGLLNRGAEVVAHDPVANQAMEERFPEVEFVNEAIEALDGAEACLVVTEWDEYSTLDEEFQQMANPLVIDGRNCVSPSAKIKYEGLTW